VTRQERAELLIPSFTAHEGAPGWHAAIYGLRAGYGPELLLHCVHLHPTMRAAVKCAEGELAWGRQIIALAERHRAIAS